MKPKVSKIVMLYCVVCGKPFRRIRNNKLKTIENTKGTRPSRCLTCSKICSKRYLYLKNYGGRT